MKTITRAQYELLTKAPNVEDTEYFGSTQDGKYSTYSIWYKDGSDQLFDVIEEDNDFETFNQYLEDQDNLELD